MAMMNNNNQSSSVVVLVAALVLLSAASTGHAQTNDVTVSGTLYCSADGNGKSGKTRGAEGVTVNLICLPDNGTIVSVASNVTDRQGMFNISASPSREILGNLSRGQCFVVVIPHAASSNCKRLPKDRPLVANVRAASSGNPPMQYQIGSFIRLERP